MQLISGQGEALLKHNLHGGLSLLFGPGERPGIGEVEHLVDSPELSSFAASVTHRPDESEGWGELLVNGLAFDLVGLAPVAAQIADEPRFSFALDQAVSQCALEAATLVPGPHLQSSTLVLPVVRAMAGLGANLALALGAKAIRWNPANAWSEPGYFARVVMDWIAGGPFPAIGMTGLTHGDDGTVFTHGLSYFAGHEIAVCALRHETRVQTAKLAVRLIDYVVRYGAITAERLLTGMSDEIMRAEPDANGEIVRIIRNVRA